MRILASLILCFSLLATGNALAQETSAYSYSWWVEPLALQHDGKIIAGAYDGSTTRQVVYRFDPGSGQIDSEFTLTEGIYSKDNHNAPAVLALSDRRLATAYTGHGKGAGDGGLLRFRVSTDMDPSNFGPEIVIADMDDNTYAQLYEWNGKLYAVSQQSDRSWWLLEAELTDLSTWVRRANLIETSAGLTQNQMYILGRHAGGQVLRFFAIPHPNNVQNSLGLFEVKLDSGEVSTGDQVLGNFREGNVEDAILTFADLATVRTPGPDHSQRLLDVSDDGTKVAITDFTTPTDGIYYIGIQAGGTVPGGEAWSFKKVAAAGAAFWNGSKYYPGVAFAREYHEGIRLYVAREDAGRGYLDRMQSADGGDVWQVENLRAIDAELTYPLSPRGATSAMPVLWQEGEIVTYRDWVANTAFLIRQPVVAGTGMLALLAACIIIHFVASFYLRPLKRAANDDVDARARLKRLRIIEGAALAVLILGVVTGVLATFDNPVHYGVAILASADGN